MTALYGIKNCDTVKKARRWLEDNGQEYNFHDFRVDGLDTETLNQWIKRLGWEVLLNKRGTTWRKLDEATQQSVNDGTIVELLLEYPALIKRPVLDTGKHLEVGFKADRYLTLFN